MKKRRNNKNKIIIDMPKGKGIIGFIRRNQNIISIIIFAGLVIGICVIFVPILDILKSFLLSLISPVEEDISVSNPVPAVLSLQLLQMIYFLEH
jgi:hypothetical protein